MDAAFFVWGDDPFDPTNRDCTCPLLPSRTIVSRRSVAAIVAGKE